MKTLYIDTHYVDVRIALFSDDGLIKEETLFGEKNNSVFVMSMISKVCQPDDIERVVVINGPGSFTGVRIGVTIAKTIAFCKNVPIKVLTYFDLLKILNDNIKANYSISDNNGYFIELEDGSYQYLNNKEYENFIIQHDNIISTGIMNYKKLYANLEKFPNSNPHNVKPLYIKLIGVENDKKF